jgi:ABC-type transporter lipoprotein component MlaA
VVKIKNGFNISIGWSLKKYKSSQRLEPLTSNPIIGTRAKSIKEIINNGITNFFNNEVSTIEIKNIVNNAKIAKLKCFEKKK